MSTTRTIEIDTTQPVSETRNGAISPTQQLFQDRAREAHIKWIQMPEPTKRQPSNEKLEELEKFNIFPVHPDDLEKPGQEAKRQDDEKKSSVQAGISQMEISSPSRSDSSSSPTPMSPSSVQMEVISRSNVASPSPMSPLSPTAIMQKFWNTVRAKAKSEPNTTAIHKSQSERTLSR